MGIKMSELIIYHNPKCSKSRQTLGLIKDRNINPKIMATELNELKKMVANIDTTELLCKKNPQISKKIFFNLFSEICKKASNFS